MEVTERRDRWYMIKLMCKDDKCVRPSKRPKLRYNNYDGYHQNRHQEEWADICQHSRSQGLDIGSFQGDPLTWKSLQCEKGEWGRQKEISREEIWKIEVYPMRPNMKVALYGLWHNISNQQATLNWSHQRRNRKHHWQSYYLTAFLADGSTIVIIYLSWMK